MRVPPLNSSIATSSLRVVLGKNTMLSIAWISSSCTTHLMIMEWNRACSGDFSVERNRDIMAHLYYHNARYKMETETVGNQCWHSRPLELRECWNNRPLQ